MLLPVLSAHAAAPRILHTPGYESPVRADPDDLLTIVGSGFESTDRVIYQAMDRPAETGTVEIVQRDHPPNALTIRLPREMKKGRPYRLWVVTSKNERSAPVAINDPRPQWITPSFAYASAEIPGLGRMIRVVGNNLAAEPLEIRLSAGKESTYTLSVPFPDNHVATAELPGRVAPGSYTVSVRGKGLDWIELPDQKFEVRPDPRAMAVFSIADGDCHPDDTVDDSSCLTRAIEAAGRAGGGIVQIPPGHWDVTDRFLIPPNVQLRGAGPEQSFLLRHGPQKSGADPLLTVSRMSSVIGLTFSDDMKFHTLAQSRSIIQLGLLPTGDESKSRSSHEVEDIIISNNRFMHVGRAITDEAGRPISRLIVTANVFGAWSDAIGLPGSPWVVWEPFQIDDSVVRGNRFIPGSYLDLTGKQGVLASGMGAARRVDFSANVVDGSSPENLQEPDDPPGFRAGLFWNLNNSLEQLLISNNQIGCSGDKVGDGEAIALDNSGGSLGFDDAPAVTAAGSDWVTVSGRLNDEQLHHKVPADYYSHGHWIQIVSGEGFGQTRRIVSYTQDEAKVTFRVSPAWDIVPIRSTLVVQRQFWQVLIVGNSIEQRAGPCRKSNLSARTGGEIGIWGASADLTIEANRQWDTDGIQFAQGHSARTPSCPTCGNSTFFQTALEIRGNLVDGEYDWSTDCSNGGIRGTFGASATPESPPPVVGFGISISHNTVIHADGFRGGGIDIPLTASPGPPPGNWPFIQNLLIFHNQLRDLDGSPPIGACHRGQRERNGIRLEGNENIQYPILYGNQCERVAKPLADSALGTSKLCSGASPGSCECQGRSN